MLAVLFFFVFAANAIAIWSAPSPADQKPLKPASQKNDASNKWPVPGDNPEVFFCGLPPEEQLLYVRDLTVAPNPIPMDHIFFFYLNGRLPDEALSGLDQAIFKINVTKDDEYTREIVANLADWPQIIVRNNFTYSHDLKPGTNEILADFYFLSFFIHAGWYTFAGELTLPDGRLLSCVETTIWLAGKA